MGRLRSARRQLTTRVPLTSTISCISHVQPRRAAVGRFLAGQRPPRTVDALRQQRAAVRCCCKSPHNVYVAAAVCLDSPELLVHDHDQQQQAQQSTTSEYATANYSTPSADTTQLQQPADTATQQAAAESFPDPLTSLDSAAPNDTPLDTPLSSQDPPSPLSSTASTLSSLDDVLTPTDPSPSPSPTPTPTTLPAPLPNPPNDPPLRHLNLSHFLPHVAFLSRFQFSLTSTPTPNYTPAYPSAAPNAEQPTPQQSSESAAADSVKLWALAMLSAAYVHQSVCTFIVPALLPVISPELGLDDFQGALLSSVPSYLYALALVPLGLLADRTHRPRLLAVSMALWSLLTIRTSTSSNFSDLLTTRLAFAGAQAAQNPICFSLIPELFPARKSFAMALYNTAIYVGRALAFLAVYITGPGSPVASSAHRVSTEMIPLDRLDLQKVSILYSSGSMAAVAPIYDYNYTIIEYAPHLVDHTPAWRHLLQWLGAPGLALAAVMLLTVPDPRAPPDTPWWQKGALGRLLPRPAALPPQAGAEDGLTGVGQGAGGASGGGAGGLVVAGAAAGAAGGVVAGAGVGVAGGAEGKASMADTLKKLMISPEFQLITFAAALNDMGSYALIAWHSTFYERVYGLAPEQYAPLLAAVLPIGGIIGGVGGGLAADWLDTKGCRYWLTVGATLAAAPCIAQSLLSPTVEGSYAALLIGAALSEAWRAPAAVAARSAAPPDSGSTASAVYLCIRNLVGGFGPLAVAQLAGPMGLQKALLLVPACFVGSGVLFAAGEVLAAQRKRREEEGGGDAKEL